MRQNPGEGSSEPRLPILSIRTKGLVWADWVILGVFLLLLPVITLMLYYLAIGGFPGGFAGALIAGISVVIVTYVIVEARVSVRRIEINPYGITFRYPFRSEHGRWEDLHPSTLPMSHGTWWLVRRATVAGRPTIRGFRLTNEQARAVLQYPACPHWELPESVARAFSIHPE